MHLKFSGMTYVELIRMTISISHPWHNWHISISVILNLSILVFVDLFQQICCLLTLKCCSLQCQRSKRSWWQRCWPQEWTRQLPTNISNRCAEMPEKEVSQKLLTPNYPHPQKCCTYSYVPAYIHLSSNPQVSFALQILARLFSVFICVLDFLYLALLLLAAQHYTSMLCNLCSVCQQPPSLLKSHLPAETLCNSGGAVSFRTAEESVENAKEILNAFDRAIAKHKNRPKIEVPKRKLPPCKHPAYPLSSCFSYILQCFSMRQQR